MQNNDGSVAVWEMNGTIRSAKSGVIANPGPTWHVAGTGDFNSDGKTDIVLQNNSGAVAVWDMNGGYNQPIRRSRQPRPDMERRW